MRQALESFNRVAFVNPTQKRFFPIGASALSGLLLVACFPLLNWHLLVWVACVPLLVALVSETRLAWAGLLAYGFGAIYLAGSCYWFVGVMEQYGGLAAPLAWGVLLLFMVVFSIFFGVFGLVVAGVARRSIKMALLLCPFLWVSLELARTYLITGFPWNLLGYAVQAPGLRQLASVAAVYGLSFLAMSTNAFFAWVFIEPQRRAARLVPAGWCLLLVIANWILTPAAVRPGSNLALLIQPNVPLDEAPLEKWAPWENPTELDRLVSMTVEARKVYGGMAGGRPLIIWSENPAPFYFNRDSIFRTRMKNLARETGAHLIFGTVNFTLENNPQPKNSAIVLDSEGRVTLEYDKIHLVPLGEYVPWWAFPGKIGKITSEVGNFAAGSRFQVARTPQGAVGIFICYEAIFPQLVRRLAAEGPGVLVNISNDTWYGDSSAPFQHLEMARLRAIENGRYLLRATNDGITAIIDPYGRLMDALPRHRTGVLPGRFDFVARRTFYTAYGDVFAWLCVAVSVAALGLRRKTM